MAQVLDYPVFATTLTISPHKNSEQIREAGTCFKNYVHFDFKQQNGYQRSIELCKLFEIYRQNYCGCEFSKKQP